MDVITIQSEAFQELKSSMDEIKKQLTAKEKEPKDKWLDNQEVMQMLHISKRLLQSWRDDGKVNFSQVGAKIYYRESEINNLLEKHQVKAFKKRKL